MVWVTMAEETIPEKQLGPELTALIEKFIGAFRDEVLPDESILERATPRWEYRNCHSYTCVECSHSRSSNGRKGHGPYLYLYWKEQGKLRKKYIGKDPENYL